MGAFRNRFGLGIAAGLVTLSLYGRALTVLPYADDMTHVVNAKAYGLWVFYPFMFFRFFERLVNAVNFQLLDQSVAITLAANFLCLAVIAVLTAALAQWLDPRRPATAMLAPILVLFHPGIASEVAQMDTLSQMNSALFALGAFAYMVMRYRPQSPKSNFFLFLLVLATLLSKEICFGQVASLVVVAFYKSWLLDRQDWKIAVRKTLLVIAVVASAAAVYMAMRYFAHSPIHTDGARYVADFGPLHIAKNIAIALGGSALVGNTVHILTGGWRGLDAWDVAGIVFSAAGWALALAGLWRVCAGRAQDKMGVADAHKIVLCLGFLLAGLFPMAIIGVVSEQYLVQLVPFLAIPAAIFLLRGYDWLASARPPAQRPWIAAALILAYVVLGTVAIQQKLGAMAVTSMRHQAYRTIVGRWMSQHPGVAGRLCLDGDIDATTTGARPYSVFSQTNSFVFDAVVAPLALQNHRALVPATLRAPMVQNQFVGATLVSLPKDCAAIFAVNGAGLSVSPG